MQYTEPVEHLDDLTRRCAMALKSMQEELEAINWYNQRVAATEDKDLKALLGHNRDEEIEHAVMLIEWLRRNMPGWDKELRQYLFTESSLLAMEEAAIEDSTEKSEILSGSLNIGSLKE
ncbi:ferritin-like domain-containing protein [Aminobacterium colombiense]|uniref:ferritin-like domain-containing protein n=1 Tax=Aminobacterium colombiense TaxID=81468 RepID=UPI002593FDCD|nr:ferritin-like domain-containing protein [uncultured Aminobacterium sp.]